MQIRYHTSEVELNQHRFALHLIPHLKEKAVQILQLRSKLDSLDADLLGWEAWLRTEGWSPNEDLNVLLKHLEGIAASAWGKLQPLHYNATALIDSLKTGQAQQKRYLQSKVRRNQIEAQLQSVYRDAHFSKLSPQSLTNGALQTLVDTLQKPKPEKRVYKPFRPSKPKSFRSPAVGTRSEPPPSQKPVRQKSSLPEHVMVPAGQFLMGALKTDSLARDTERPPHQVDISHMLLVMKYPVTQELYTQLVGQNPSHFENPSAPVESVSWYDAISFANALSEANGLKPAYTVNGTQVSWETSADGWRLPTEAEWEYCARGGAYQLYAGSDTIDSVAWYTENSSATVSVGQKKSNGFGIYDMSGNVLEWCWDRWKREYRKRAAVDPIGPDQGSTRIVRGGGWNNSASLMRLSARNSLKPDIRFNGLGFRLVRSV